MWFKKLNLKYSRRHYKYAFNFDRGTFVLLGGQLDFFDGFHAYYLMDRYGVEQPFSEILINAFPRGRAERSFLGVVVEGSPELEHYRQELARGLSLEPQDRPKFRFDVGYYNADFNYAQKQFNEQVRARIPRRATIEFIQQYLPHLDLSELPLDQLYPDLTNV
jgi:hypothetical protein